MRFQIDDRVKLVFPNGFSESSFAPRITQNDWSERAAVYSIRDSFEFFGKRSIRRKTMSVSIVSSSMPSKLSFSLFTLYLHFYL